MSDTREAGQAPEPVPTIQEKPLAEASRRLAQAERDAKKVQRRALLTPEQRETIAQRMAKARAAVMQRRGSMQSSEKVRKLLMMRAAGATLAQCAAELDVSHGTVVNYLAKPELKKDLLELRQKVREKILEECGGELLTGAFKMARAKVQAEDGKEFDATMRGLHAIEKMTASASGEARKVELEQIGENKTPVVALQVLLQQVLGDA